MTRLEFLKDKCTRVPQFHIIQDDLDSRLNFLNEPFIKLHQKVKDFSDNIKNCKSEEELFEHLKNIKDDLLNTWRLIDQYNKNLKEDLKKDPSNKDLINLKDKLDFLEKAVLNIYFENNIANLSSDELKQKIFQEYEDKYDSNWFNKVYNHILEQIKVPNFNSSIDGFEVSIDDVNEVSHYIMEKYGFKSINLNYSKSYAESLQFLLDFDSHAEIWADTMGCDTQLLGFNKTYSLMYNDKSAAMSVGAYCSWYEKYFMFKSSTVGASIIAHEWVHGLDSFVFQEINNGYINPTDPKYYVSDFDENIPINNSELLKMYKDLRIIMKELYAGGDLTEIRRDVSSRYQTAISSMWETLLGTDNWTSMPNEQRQKYLSNDMLLVVNNLSSSGVDLKSVTVLSEKLKELGHSQTEIQNIITRENLSKISDKISPTLNGILSITSKDSIFYNLNKLNDFYFKLYQKVLNTEVKNNTEILSGEYFKTPTELLARYFQAQLFKGDTNNPFLNIMLNATIAVAFLPQPGLGLDTIAKQDKYFKDKIKPIINNLSKYLKVNPIENLKEPKVKTKFLMKKTASKALSKMLSLRKEPERKPTPDMKY